MAQTYKNVIVIGVSYSVHVVYFATLELGVDNKTRPVAVSALPSSRLLSTLANLTSLSSAVRNPPTHMPTTSKS